MSEEIEKSIRPEVTKEQLGMVIESLMEAIEGMIEMPEEEDSAEMETETEDENPLVVQEGSTGPKAIGDPDKNPVNWPVAKSADEEDYESDNEEVEQVNKSIWDGKFNPNLFNK